MDGVTILNTITENISNIESFVMLLFFSIALIILLLVAIVLASDGFSEINGYVITYITVEIVAIILLVLSIMELNTTPEKSQILYEVTISEEVSFKDFTSKYEIIEQRGEIYIVKERESNGS